MADQILAPVRDAVALSSRESAVFFDVKRDGTITLFSDYAESKHEETILFRLEEADDDWHWRNGWLPILQIGKRYELFASGDDLFVRDGDRYSAFPDRRELSGKEFENAVSKIEIFWKQWFETGLELPVLHPELDAAWRSSLVQALCTFAGRHPSYGALYYRQYCHDAFPPNVITMCEALMQFRHDREAAEIFLYYMDRFVRADGTIDYYGPSVAEYGGLMSLAAMLVQANPPLAAAIVAAVRRLIHQVLDRCNRFLPQPDRPGENWLLSGSPEADERKKTGEYFHNNFQILRGLRTLSPEIRMSGNPELAGEMEKFSGLLEKLIFKALETKKQSLGAVPFSMSQEKVFDDIQQDRDAIYANYRYYPEMLECAYLSPEDAESCFSYREQHHGEYYGMTLFTCSREGGITEVDNWPMASYARALLEYGQRERFMRLLAAQFRYYISSDVYTAYEQVLISGNPRVSRMPACVPVQLLLPRLLAWSYFYRRWDGNVVQWGGPSTEELKSFGLQEISEAERGQIKRFR